MATQAKLIVFLLTEGVKPETVEVALYKATLSDLLDRAECRAQSQMIDVMDGLARVAHDANANDLDGIRRIGQAAQAKARERRMYEQDRRERLRRELEAMPRGVRKETR